MKKKTAKLRLDKETIKQLQGTDLRGAAGGRVKQSDPVNCTTDSADCPTAHTCLTQCGCSDFCK